MFDVRSEPIGQRLEAVPTGGRSLHRDVAEGVLWLWRNPGLRILAACILVMNITGVGALALWALCAREHLGLTETQFGLLLTAGAVGGITGSWIYGRLETIVGHVALLRAGLVLESLT